MQKQSNPPKDTETLQTIKLQAKQVKKAAAVL